MTKKAPLSGRKTHLPQGQRGETVKGCSGRSRKSCWWWTTGAPACLGSLGASCYSLELDFSLIQKVGVEEPAEKQVQAGGDRRGAAQTEGELQSNMRDTQPSQAFPVLSGQDPLHPTLPEQPLLPHKTTVECVITSWMARIAGGTQIPDQVLLGSAEPQQVITATSPLGSAVAAW